MKTKCSFCKILNTTRISEGRVIIPSCYGTHVFLKTFFI